MSDKKILDPALFREVVEFILNRKLASDEETEGHFHYGVDDAIADTCRFFTSQTAAPIQRRVKYYRGHRVLPYQDGGAGAGRGSGYQALIWFGFPMRQAGADGATPDEALEAAVQEVLKVRGEA